MTGRMKTKIYLVCEFDVEDFGRLKVIEKLYSSPDVDALSWGQFIIEGFE